MKYRVVFFGSSKHSLPALEALGKDALYEIVAVVSQEAKPAGRKQIITDTPVSEWAKNNHIELITPKSWKKVDEELGENIGVNRLKQLKPDLGVLVYYGKILPQSVLDVFPKGIVNTHPSLLPKYRGATPGQMAILNGDKKSGVSLMLLVQEMDAGPILGQEQFALSESETPETYYTKGFEIGADLMLKVLPKYMNGELKLIEQNGNDATYSPLLNKEAGKIDWSKSVEEIERMVRAFSPWPGTWTEVEVENGMLVLSKLMQEKLNMNYVKIVKQAHNANNVYKKRLKIISCHLENGRLFIDRVVLEGEKETEFEKLNIA